MKKSVFTILLAFAAATFLLAQSTPRWTANLDKTIEWSKLLPNGILLIGTSDYGMHGLDPQTGNILWSEEKIMREVSSVRGPDGKKVGYTDEYVTALGESVPELNDYISVRFTDNAMMKNFIVINTKTGKIIFHPAEVGAPSFKVLGKTSYQFNYNGSGVIPELNLIILQVDYVNAYEKGKPHIHFKKGINLQTGEELWKVEGIAGDFLPMVLKDQNMLYVNNHIIAKVDPVAGKMIWRADLGSDKKDVISQVVYDLEEKAAYVFGILNKRASIVALDLSSGKQMWNNEFKAKGSPVLTATRSGLVMSDEKNFVMYDFASGNQKWTAKKLEGDVVDMGSDGVLVAAREKFLTLLDGENGEEKWSKKVKGIQIDQVTDKGIIYYNENNAMGVVDYKGEEYWNKMLPEINATAQASFSELVVLSKDDLYAIDLTDFSQKLLAQNINFKGDETPDLIESYEDGIVVSSSQNVWLVDRDGNIKFERFYRAPGAGGVLAAKIIKTTLMVASTAAASAAAYQQGMNSSNAYWSNHYGNQRKAWEDFSSNIGKIDASRAYKKATKNSERYAYILTRVDEGDGKGTGILKLDKLTGETAGQIVLNDSKPVYEVDAENGKIFHRVSKSTIACYDL